MSTTKFLKYFKSSLVNEAIDPAVTPPTNAPVTAPVVDDEAVLSQTFEDDAQKQKLDTEISNISLSPEQKADILRKADKYSDNITKIVLPTLRKLHDDIVSGVFASIAPDVKGISGINEDLAGLAEALRGRTRDAVLKADKVEKKQ
jgi:hypothetical protein